MDKKQIITKIYILAFFLLMLFPLVLTNNEEDYVSEIDNRKLTEFPVMNKSFASNFEAYMQDRIGMRSQMIEAYAVLNDVLFNELSHPLYMYGKDGYIFFNQSDNIKYSDWHRQFAEMVLKMQTYCEERGSKFYFMFEPEKNSVLREKLPEGEIYDDSWAEQMLSYMEELGINCIDNREFLIQKNLEEEVFNKQYDAGHWNDTGCFYATNNLLKAINKDMPEVTELSKDEFEITNYFERYLPNSRFLINEEVLSYSSDISYDNITNLYNKDMDINPQYRNFWYLKRTDDIANYLPRMLVFQGSYYISRPQFILNRAKEYIALHNYQNVMDLDYYYNLFFPDVVVFEVSQYTLNDSYFDSGRMALIDWNKPIVFREGDDFFKQKQQLMGIARQKDIDAHFKLKSGDNIDEVFLDKKMSNIQYGYIITDDRIIDLTQKEKGVFRCACMQGQIKDGQEVILYYLDDAQKAYYCYIDVVQATKLTNITTSKNAKKDGNNSFDMTTNKSFNCFDAVGQQLCEKEGIYITDISFCQSEGTYMGLLCNESGKDEYIIRLKANSNFQDEYIDYHETLEDKEVCFYEYSIKRISYKRVLIDYYFIYK